MYIMVFLYIFCQYLVNVYCNILVSCVTLIVFCFCVYDPVQCFKDRPLTVWWTLIYYVAFYFTTCIIMVVISKGIKILVIQVFLKYFGSSLEY